MGVVRGCGATYATRLLFTSFIATRPVMHEMIEMWFGVVWCSVVWCSVVWCGLWYGAVCGLWCRVVCGVVCFVGGVVQCGAVQSGVVW